MFVKLFESISKLFLTVAVLLLTYFILTNTEEIARIFIRTPSALTEGVIVPADFKINKISPIFPTPVQIERDISNLIYEPMFRFYGENQYENVLAESVILSEDKKALDINLKQDVKWSDGISFSANDVIATFEMIKGMNAVSSAQEVLKESMIEKTGDFSLKLTLPRYEPTILEDLTFGILPEHILKTEKVDRFRDHIINSEPLGTGPFMLAKIAKDRVVLTKNPNYRELVPFDEFTIRFFEDRETLLINLKNGNIQLASTIDNQLLISEDLSLDTYIGSNISIINSNSMQNRTFGLYFNLKDLSSLPDDQKKIYGIYQDTNIRKALSLAINRDEILAILGKESEASFRLYPEDFSINKDSRITQTLDLEKARQILEQANWKIDQNTNIRTKDGEKLVLNISYLGSPEKKKLMNILKDQFDKLNIEINLEPLDLSSLNNKLTSKTFGIILYGVETYFDMDRFKLWSETQISEVGLNISSFRSTQKVLDPITGQSESKLQDALLQGRNTITDRQKWYRRVQNIINDETPMIYLYHPSIQVLANTKIKNVDLTNIAKPEDRYNYIYKWTY